MGREGSPAHSITGAACNLLRFVTYGEHRRGE